MKRKHLLWWALVIVPLISLGINMLPAKVLILLVVIGLPITFVWCIITDHQAKKKKRFISWRDEVYKYKP